MFSVQIISREVFVTPQRLHAKLLQLKLIFLGHYTMVRSAVIKDFGFLKTEQIGLKF